ncbi:EamA family transporter [uncultured Methanoregula sp.]|uniref:EamA family transporter n=1 Tax=uncultured Methanoregula sp. TaxID=1005933 RepID=UPI002AAB57D3|nr:EamA family transporter [uncultured Methanoregula sp.]
MFWALLSGIGACTNAGYYIANKKFLDRIDSSILGASGFLFTSVILLAISSWQGIPVLGPLFFPAVIITSAINIVAMILTFRALASTDISLAIPMISFTPIFLVGTAFLILHEMPSAAGVAGIIIIVFGSYVLNAAKEHTRLADPFRAMAAHSGVLAMLAVAFLYAIAANFDKMTVQNSDVVFGSGIMFLLLGSAFLIIAVLQRARAGPAARMPVPGGVELQPSPTRPFCWREVAGAGIFIGSLITIETVSINTAYTLQITPYVIALKRMGIILIVLYGIFVFHEKETLRRLSGAVLMVIGAILILLFP